MACFFRVLAVYIAIVAGTSAFQNDPLDVHQQCREKSYDGACIEAPAAGIYPMRCSNLQCARSIDAHHWVAHGIGAARDGTYCGSGKACFRGKCDQRIQRITPYGKDTTLVCAEMPRFEGKGTGRASPRYLPTKRS